nr:ABC-2 family transporter protein [Anoxybacter fermentans]
MIRRFLIISFKKTLEYRFNLISYFCTNLLLFLLQILFWNIIFKKFNGFYGWKIEQLIMLYSYTKIYYNLNWALSSGTFQFWRSINSGELDVFLTKPVNPNWMIVGLRINFMPLFQLGFEITLMFIVLSFMGYQIDILRFIESLIMICLVVYTMNRIYLALNYTAFWIKQANFVVNILTMINPVIRYPITIYPDNIIKFFTYVLPLVFLATYPTLFTSHSITNEDFFQINKTLVLVAITWTIITAYIWRKGLKNYESGRG